MAQLVERGTNKIVDVPDEEVQSAFQSGQYGFVKGTTVNIADESGATRTVDASEAANIVAGGKGTFAGVSDPAAEEREREFGGIKGELIAGGLGAVRGLTFGLADPAALAIAHAVGGREGKAKLREQLEGYKETNPYASLGGELAGAVLPSVFTGGAAEDVALAREGVTLAKEAGTVAKVAGTAEEAATLAKEGSALKTVGQAALSASPAKLSSLGADAAEKAVAAVIGEGSENTFARVLQKGLAKGAGGFIEGGLYGVGDQISEDTLGDHEITGEKLAAAFGHGGFYGSLIGGGLGAGGEALSSGAKWALTKAAPAAQRAAEDMTIKSLSYGGLAPKGLMNALERAPGGKNAVARELLDRDLIRMGDSFETIQPRIHGALDEAADALGTGRKALDSAGVEGPKISSITDRITKDAEAKFGRLRELNSGAFGKIDDAIASLKGAHPGEFGTFEGLAAFRKDIDQQIRWAATAPGAPINANQEALKIVRSAVEDELEKATDAASSKMGGDVLKEYKTAKQTFQRLKVAADLVDDSVTRATKNQTLGVSDKMLAGMGLLHGLATGNPLAAAGGLALSALHHVAMERGPATAASMLNKVADLAAVRKSVEAIDGRMSKGLDGFLGNKAPEHETKVFRSASQREEAFEGAVKRVKSASVNPETSADHVQKALAGIVQSAPKIATAASVAAGRAATFLAAKVPPPKQTKTITPQFETDTKPSPADQERFLRYVKAADDPLSVLDDMSKGRLTKEGVETLREVYPMVYEELQKQAIEKCADAKHPLNYNQKMQLGLLLGVPTDTTLDPGFIGRMQAMHQANSGDKNGAGGAVHGPPKRPLQDFSSTAKLGTQRSDR